MAAKKAPKESNLVLNIVMIVSILAFALFIYRERAAGGASAVLRSPQTALKAFVEEWREKRGDVLRFDFEKPPMPPMRVDEIPHTAGWAGLEKYIAEEDLIWLRDNANHISLGVAQTYSQWEEMDTWDRYVTAKGAVMESAPNSDFKVNEQFEDKEGNAELQIQTTQGGLSKVNLKKIDGKYQIVGFFGSKGFWTSNLRTLDMRLPEELRRYR